MVVIIVVFVLVLAIATYQVTQGFYSALIMAILTALCAAIAFSYYEPLASALLYTRQPGYGDAAALIALFVLPLLALRILFDRFLGANAVMDPWIDRIAGGVCGLFTGMVLVGVLMVAIQMLPMGASEMTYSPYKDTLQRDQKLWPFRPDEMTIGMIEMFSGSLGKNQDYDRRGVFSTDPVNPFGRCHDDLLLELFCSRNTAGNNGRTDAYPNALTIEGIYQIPLANVDKSWNGDELPKYPLENPDLADTNKIIIVRAKVDASAADLDSFWRLPATHFRLACQNDSDASFKSYYPVGFLTYARPAPKTTAPKVGFVAPPGDGWTLHAAPKANKDSPAEIAKLLVTYACTKELEGGLRVDWVYRVGADQNPEFLVFRRVARDSVGKDRFGAITQNMPDPKGALFETPETKR